MGHGYFVTSKTGEIDIWDGPSNHTAHNVLLQVLVTTGAIGTVLFLWGLFQPLVIYGNSLPGVDRRWKLATFLGVLGIWYFGWGQLCASFMGPVRPESVVFFALLGLALGSVPTGRQS
jgi:O-antigen ligase